MRVRQAVILAGGRATRLGPLAAETPKPLLPVGDGRPFLDHVIDTLARQGFDRVLILAGHLGARIAERYAGRANVRVRIEAQPLDTAGAVRDALPDLEAAFLLLNGDTLFDANLRALEAGWTGRDAVLAARRVDDAGRYGRLSVAGDGRVAAFAEKTPDAGPGLINAGACLLPRALVAGWPAGRLSLERAVMPDLAARGLVRAVERDGFFLDIGLPETLAAAREALPTGRARPAVFFDRDGVLNVDAGYTHRVEDLVWTPGARAAVRAVNEAGWRAIVVTNQAGVARGLYDEAAVGRFHEAMQDQLAAAGAFIDAFYHCPFHPEAVVAAYRADHEDRKPRPGMLLRAMRDWSIDAARSVLIGDKPSDLEAAAAAGVRAVAYAGGDLEALTKEAMA